MSQDRQQGCCLTWAGSWALWVSPETAQLHLALPQLCSLKRPTPAASLRHCVSPSTQGELEFQGQNRADLRDGLGKLRTRDAGRRPCTHTEAWGCQESA